MTLEVFRNKDTGGVGNALGCNIYVFDLRYQQEYSFAQPIEVRFLFANIIRENTASGYAFNLTNSILAINSDGQRHLDLKKL